jgi:hypothetical protein
MRLVGLTAPCSHAHPSEARGLSGALSTIEQQPFGALGIQRRGVGLAIYEVDI